jgi:hypothetical protein
MNRLYSIRNNLYSQSSVAGERTYGEDENPVEWNEFVRDGLDYRCACGTIPVAQMRDTVSVSTPRLDGYAIERVSTRDMATPRSRHDDGMTRDSSHESSRTALIVICTNDQKALIKFCGGASAPPISVSWSEASLRRTRCGVTSSPTQKSSYEDTEDASGSDEESILANRRAIRNRNRARRGEPSETYLDTDDEYRAQFES